MLLSVLLTLIWSGLWARPYPVRLWQIGKADGSSSEFALDGDSYSDISKRFPGCTALYTVGRSSASDVPFVIPGPSDAWAGNPQGGLLVRFGVREADPGAALRLRFDFVEVHSGSAPRLEITLNDFRTEVQTPAGADQNYLDTRKTSSKGLCAEVEIPAGTLRPGDNILSVRSVSGSWMVLDAVTLEASTPVESAPVGTGISLFAAESEPALIYGRTRDELLHPVTLDIANWDAKPRKTAWSYDGKAGGELKLAPGLNRMQVGIPEGYDGRRVRFALRTPDGDRSVETEILPAERWTVYLVQHTHTDIGYTKPQTEILTEHLRYIDYAIEYCEATADYPDDAKFRWTCEASWAVREWLRIRPAEQVERFLRFVKNGQIEVTAMFFNMSELSGENAYKTFLAPIARFHELGIPVETAMQDDVNGVAWCLADYLPDVGVKYLSMGSNGHRALIPFDRPTLYRWESPSGKSLLSFRADHYMTANFWGIDRGDMEGVRNGVFSYIRSLRRSGYDFPLVAAQYSGYSTDNSPPSMQECALIRDWNEHYAWPRLRSATVHEFLEQINTKYGDRLPVYRAAYPDWWTDGFGSAARETAASRKTQSDMIAIGGMLSMAGMAGDRGVEGTHDELRRIQKDEKTSAAQRAVRAREIARRDTETLLKKTDAKPQPVKEFVPLKEVQIGQEVVIADLGQTATVTARPDRNGMVEVRAGIMKTKVPLTNLRAPDKMEKRKPAEPRRSTRVQLDKSRKTSMELNLLGYTVDEALNEVDKFLDSGMLRGQSTLYIIHGNGTGALRTAIQKHLRTHKAVKSFRLGRYGEGESGVTVVELK